MKLSIKAGSTSQSFLVYVQDSTSTTGAGLTGLAYNTSSLTCYYARPGVAAAVVSLVTQTVTGAYSSGGFVQIDATNMPGWYRFDPPDAALAAGVRSAGFHLKGAANMVPLPIEVELTGWDNQDAVRGGLTALPNAAAAASGGLPTFGTGSGQINPASGKVPATLAAADVTGNVAVDLQTIKTQAVTCSAGVTVNPYVGTATAALGVDASGRVQVQYGTAAGQVNLSGGNLAGAVPSVTADVGITQAGADKVWSTTARAITDKANFTLATSDHAAIADKFLGRSIVGGADGGRTVKQAMQFQRNAWSISSSTLTVMAEDDTTPVWTATLTFNAGGIVTSFDPD